jgi:hypothetical protein
MTKPRSKGGIVQPLAAYRFAVKPEGLSDEYALEVASGVESIKFNFAKGEAILRIRQSILHLQFDAIQLLVRNNHRLLISAEGSYHDTPHFMLAMDDQEIINHEVGFDYADSSNCVHVITYKFKQLDTWLPHPKRVKSDPIPDVNFPTIAELMAASDHLKATKELNPDATSAKDEE